MIWRQFQHSCVDLIVFCDYHEASDSIRTHLLPAQTACTQFQGAFSPDPNVIKLLACLGAPAFHMRILDESPPLESKVQLRSWTVFEGFHVLVAKGEDWRVPELFINMFESTVQIQVPPTLVPDVDRSASFLDVDESNLLFSSCERRVTGGLRADSDRMDIDSPLRLPPYDISAVGSDGIDFYNFKDMGQEDGLEPREAHEHSDYEVDIGDFDEEMFRKQPRAHPVDFMRWDEGDMDPGPSTSLSSRKRRHSPSLCEQTPVAKNSEWHWRFLTPVAMDLKGPELHMNTSGNDVSATRNPIVKSSKRRISLIEELPAGTVRRRRTRSSSQEPVFILEGFEEMDMRILRGEWPPEFLVMWAVTPIERWEQAPNSVRLSESRQIKLFNNPTRRLRVNPKVVTFVPPPHIFYNTVRLSAMIYNWLLIRDAIIHSFDANPSDLKSAHHLQNSECWRHSLSGVLPADLRALAIESLHIAPVPLVLPNKPFPLVWRNWHMADMETLTSDDLLVLVVWELNEIFFMFGFILLDDTILSNAATPVSTRRMCRKAFLKSYNMRLDLVLMYKYRERAIESTDDIWTNHIGFVKVFGQIMWDWPEFPRHCKDFGRIASLNKQLFLKIEEELICFFIRTYADYYSRHPNLPSVCPHVQMPVL
ncbi:hypothetical protein K439DRAFT_1619962 [Ramaria rubella]|nr:hypothetical protein K439DRAFT_1619962 [Ramaria rubella]